MREPATQKSALMRLRWRKEKQKFDEGRRKLRAFQRVPMRSRTVRWEENCFQFVNSNVSNDASVWPPRESS